MSSHPIAAPLPVSTSLPRIAIATFQAAVQTAVRAAARTRHVLRDVTAPDALRGLNDHMLRDINLSRADVEAEYPEFPSQSPNRPLF